MQHTSKVLMIRPINFGYNAETAVNNHFQVRSEDNVQQKALQEFDALVNLLRENDIDVTVVNDTPAPHTPDSIFPNNWISFHESGDIVLYPMFAENRRLERKRGVMDLINTNFTVKNISDLSAYEADEQFLEGTGSMVLDRDNRIAYACLSPRTDKTVLEEFCTRMQFTMQLFHAVDKAGNAIYHTNVMMCVADAYVVICLEAVQDADERTALLNSFAATNKTVIEISYDQMDHFAGNMLQLHNNSNEKFIVMSSQAYRSLTTNQITQLETFNKILHADIATIETNGGGSARCMIAEVFLDAK